MMMETFSMVSPMASSSGWWVAGTCGRDVCWAQMQPRGLGMPAILAAILAGPFGNSW